MPRFHVGKQQDASAEKHTSNNDAELCCIELRPWCGCVRVAGLGPPGVCLTVGFQNGHPAFHKQIGQSSSAPNPSLCRHKKDQEMMQVSMQRMRLVSSVAVALAVIVIGGTALAQSAGTWKLNLAKSKYTEGQAPKSSTLVYEPAGAGIKVTVDMMPADGPAIHYAYSANYDGKDVPVVGNPNGDTAARTRLDPTTTKLVNKKDGQIVSNMTLVDSADGKTLTITTTGKDAKGQNIDSVAVYEKQ
jgi:hypothetical protein